MASHLKLNMTANLLSSQYYTQSKKTSGSVLECKNKQMFLYFESVAVSLI